MKLVLAEKPSVAMSLSKVIGANQRGDGYMEGNGYLVSWCVGHLVELSQPEAYDEKYAKWRYDDLPILPEHWQYASTKKQFGILKKLMQRKEWFHSRTGLPPGWCPCCSGRKALFESD